MNRRHLHRIKRRDTIARWVIKTGGIGVIFCVFGMLALIASTALPLFFPAKASPVAVAPGAADAGATNGTLAVLVDDDRLAVWSLRADGTAELREVGSGKLLEKKRIRPDGADRKIVACEAAGAQNFSLLWDDGAALAVKVEFKAATAADGIKSVTCGVRTLWRVQRPEGVTDGGINAKNGRTEERKNGIKDERKNGRAEQDVRNTPDVHDTRNAHSAAACQAVALRPGDEGGAPSTTVACPAVALRPGNEGGAPSTTVACPAVALRPGEEGGGTQVWHLADGNFLVISEIYRCLTEPPLI